MASSGGEVCSGCGGVDDSDDSAGEDSVGDDSTGGGTLKSISKEDGEASPGVDEICDGAT